MPEHKHLFPSLLAKPISLIPPRLHAEIVARILNHFFAEQISDDELAFFDGRILSVEVADTGIQFNLSFNNRHFSGSQQTDTANLGLRGNLHDFLQLATRREDSDTLFFQRRLKVEGDTEMGLAIKNFLDAIEIESLPWHQQMQGALNQMLNQYERFT